MVVSKWRESLFLTIHELATSRYFLKFTDCLEHGSTVVHGQWRVRLHFRQPITKQNMKHMKFQLAQQREGREVPNEPQADLSQDQKVITMMDAYYSRATDNRVVITTLPQALNSQNLVQIVPFEPSRK